MVMQPVAAIVKAPVRQSRTRAHRAFLPTGRLILALGLVLGAAGLAFGQGQYLATVASAAAFVAAILIAAGWGRRLFTGRLRQRWLAPVERSAGRYFIWACLVTLASFLPLIPASALSALIADGIDLQAIVDQPPLLVRLFTLVVLAGVLCRLVADRLAERGRAHGRVPGTMWNPGRGRTARLVVGSLAVWLVPLLIVVLTVGTIDHFWRFQAEEPVQDDEAVVTAPAAVTPAATAPAAVSDDTVPLPTGTDGA